MRPILFALTATILSAGSLAAQDFRWHGAIASGKSLEVRGINGRVRASRATGSEAEVTATKRAGRRGDPDDVQIKTIEDAEGVVICAVYPSRHDTNDCRRSGGNNDVQNNDVEVNFEVKVPAGVNFTGETVNGDVEAAELPADAEVATVNGDVEVTAAGTARASTVNGSVTATVGKSAWSGTLEFSTVNGGIEVTLPSDIDAEVDANTVNGSITSDFPITMQGRMRKQQLHGTIGKGGRGLKLTTVNGGIELRKK